MILIDIIPSLGVRPKSIREPDTVRESDAASAQNPNRDAPPMRSWTSRLNRAGRAPLAPDMSLDSIGRSFGTAC